MKRELPATENIQAHAIPLWARFTAWFMVESESVTTTTQFVLFVLY
jgi:hypothetical protein